MLVTGPTGSGKSTSLAAMIDAINETREEHIMTIEDPIEFLHAHKKCIVNQRELGSDATSFAAALKAALRQDPDVILVGEMRDLETISTALTAAETGHLVFATLHTQDAPQTIDRIIDVFPPAPAGPGPRRSSSVALQGVVTQQLLPTADGSGRVVAGEVLVPDAGGPQPDPRGQDPPDLLGAADRRAASGMQTMDAALAAARARRARSPAQLAEQRSVDARGARAACWAPAMARRWRRSADGDLRLQGDRPRRRARHAARSRPRPSRPSPTSSSRAA